VITLEQAIRIASGTLALGRERDAKPLTVVVLDAGGHVVVTYREDRSGILRVQIATGKAWGALGMGVSSRELGRRAANNPPFAAAMSAASEGRLIPVPGGVLIRDDDGEIVGAVGVSGDTSEVDEACAIAAVRAAGLEPEPANEA
jgi:uncharacterized protein GlcG (DUF336 family)